MLRFYKRVGDHQLASRTCIFLAHLSILSGVSTLGQFIKIITSSKRPLHHPDATFQLPQWPAMAARCEHISLGLSVCNIYLYQPTYLSRSILGQFNKIITSPRRPVAPFSLHRPDATLQLPQWPVVPHGACAYPVLLHIL